MTVSKKKDHLFYMHQALEQAKKALKADEVPIGAVIVDSQGTVIGRGYNKIEKLHSQAGHAEVLAINNAGKKIDDWRLLGCWMYVTLEPCAMCLHLILLSRMEGVVFGASSPLFGYHLDKVGTLSIYKNSRLPIEIIGAIAEQEAAQLLKYFFKKKRDMSD